MQFQPHRPRKVIINITSLIDVVFLLLIFFMVSTTFLEQPGISLDLPDAQSTVKTESNEVVLVISTEGEIYLDGGKVELEKLENQLKYKFKAQPDNVLILRADKDVSHGTVVKVMDIAKKIGIKKLVVATKAE